MLDGVKADKNNLTINDLYNSWVQLKRGLKDNTFSNYKYMYTMFFEPDFGKRKIVDLKRSDIRSFYNYLADERHIQINTIDCIHTVLNQVLELGVEDDYLRYNSSENALKRDLEKLFNLHSMRKSLDNAEVNKDIAGRYYQEGAIKAVCGAFGKANRRKALLVMATGSGKTRTVIALCDVLLTHGWVKNILFLADRNSLVTQAKRSFVNLLPDLSVTNLCEEKDNYTAHCVFSTYQTMMNVIDTAKDDKGKLFTVGHFDLVICDEAHRSIYNKYRDIFNYFDAPLVGLTATPKDEIDKNTYEAFD